MHVEVEHTPGRVTFTLEPGAAERTGRPYQALFAVVQGAAYEDLRRRATHDLAALTVDGCTFDGYGIGGALEKDRLGTIVGWCTTELPEDKPRHLLGISEPDDLFAAVEHGAVSATQFHPEKSGDAGAALLENWLRTL